MKKTDILDVVSRKLSPFVFLFGFYVISHGHISPGGGFQGGVVLASGFILLLLCQQEEGRVERLFPLGKIRLAEAGAFLLFLLAGVLGMILTGSFLGVFFEPGISGRIPDALFVFFLNLIIGVKVGAGISIVCFYLFRE